MKIIRNAAKLKKDVIKMVLAVAVAVRMALAVAVHHHCLSIVRKNQRKKMALVVAAVVNK